MTEGKHRYALPLDAEFRARLGPLARPYPRGRSIESDAPAVQAGEGAAKRPARSTQPEDEPLRAVAL